MSPENKLTGLRALAATITIFGSAALYNRFTESNGSQSGEQSVYASMGLNDEQAKILVNRINISLQNMKNCTNIEVQKAADRFDDLNHKSKLINIKSGKNNDQPFSVLVTNNDQPFSLVAFNPDILLNRVIEAKEIEKSIFEAVYIYDRIAKDPIRYDIDASYKDQIDKSAALIAENAFCLK